MTEEEAKQKWCPFARAGITVDVPSGDRPAAAVNRPHPKAPVQFTACHASVCMAWRWELGAIPGTSGGAFVGNDEQGAPARGYCGLAGMRPEFLGRALSD
jgi:hypothetical protein